MTDPSEQQRAAIRNACVKLRRLLASVRPPDMPAILEQVRRIESAALMASLDEFPAIRKRFEWLIGQLQQIDGGDGEKIITHSRWKQFFGRT
ncbi:MAG TPA: hypothetical protein VM709_07075 [Candidatus Sulfotelmatobacter sp.]|nr:hypothetical protein [Candidatus Sulfotelmatobacter sp.]